VMPVVVLIYECVMYHEVVPQGPIWTIISVHNNNNNNSLALVCKRNILTEQPPLVGEDSANFCGYRGVR
jgi:hypothetical protein